MKQEIFAKAFKRNYVSQIKTELQSPITFMHPCLLQHPWQGTSQPSLNLHDREFTLQCDIYVINCLIIKKFFLVFTRYLPPYSMFQSEISISSLFNKDIVSPKSFRPGLFNLSINILGWMFLYNGGCPVGCRMFSRRPGLYLPDTISSPLPV